METGDLVEMLETTKTPAGFILVFLVILATFSGLVSKAAADYGGVFGAFARALQRRKDEAIEADERSNARRLDRLEETIETHREIADAIAAHDPLRAQDAMYLHLVYNRKRIQMIKKDSE